MQFFPSLPFGWFFYGLLLVCLLALVVSDLRQQRLPNYLTMPMLLLGLLLNLLRAAWLGQQGEAGRYFGLTGIGGGLVEGFCFSIAGLLIGFALFTLLWQLKKCGAGDVKLMAALGTWIGPLWFFFVFVGTIIATVFLMIIWWCYAWTMKRNPGLKISYALPAMISTAVMMLWFWRRDLF